MEVNCSRNRKLQKQCLSFRLKIIKKYYVLKRMSGARLLGQSDDVTQRNKSKIALYRFHVSLQDFAQPFVQGRKVGSLVRFVNPAVPHESVHFQRTLGWVLHPLSITQVVKQLLCGQARVGGTSKSKCLPQQDAKRPSGNVKKSNISNIQTRKTVFDNISKHGEES